MLISVVIPSFNRMQNLQRCLNSLQSQTLDFANFEVIVVNDGSTDGTERLLQDFKKTTTLNLVIINQKNAGPSAARNNGVSESKSDLIAFIDDDCVADKNWLLDYIELFSENENLAGIGGGIHRLNNTVFSQYIDDYKPLTHAEHNGEVDYLITANAAFRKRFFEKVSGFNTDFKKPGGEDPDLSWRMKKMGFKLSKSNKAVVKHNHRDSLKGIYLTMFSYGRAMSILQNLGYNLYYKADFKRFFSEFIIALKSFFSRKNLNLKRRFLYFFADCAVFTGLFYGFINGEKNK